MCVCVRARACEAEDIQIIAVVVSQKNLGGVVSQKIISCTTPMKPLGGVEKQRLGSPKTHAQVICSQCNMKYEVQDDSPTHRRHSVSIQEIEWQFRYDGFVYIGA